MNKKIIALVIIVFMVGSVVGYSIGFTSGLNWSVGKAIYFLELKGIELDINKEEIVYGIQMYKNHFNACYPDLQNALEHNN